MTDNEYLAKILEEQTLETGGSELKDLNNRGKEVKDLLEEHFTKCDPTIRYGGSKAKGTMIKESYDLDIICYFPRDDEDAGKTLKEIYEETEAALKDDYFVDRKASALRLREKATETTGGLDFHIDVVPGRYVKGDTGDVYIYQHAADKDRLKTNIEKHIGHVKDSQVIEAIRLMKLWNVRNGLNVKTFVLELLVIDLLSGKKSSTLTSQLTHVWKKFRDESKSLSVKDPANENNDLSSVLNAAKPGLEMVARSTLSTIENSGWEAVFGKLQDSDSDANKSLKLEVAATAATTRSKPWMA